MKTFQKRRNTKRNRWLIGGLFAVILCLLALSLMYFMKNDSQTEQVLSTSQQAVEEQNETQEEESVQEPAKPKPKATPKPQTESKPQSKPTWPVTYSLNEAASLTVVVNKKHRLPSSYEPKRTSVAGGYLRPEAASAMSKMLAAAKNANVPMRIISSYRSYATQVTTYNGWVQKDGKAQADRYSARPGHSEHQTGLAADLGTFNSTCDLEICFGATVQGKWLAAHAADYGFIIRYESDTETLTGYQYEPWHVRFLGVSVAKAVKKSGKTLDQYYGFEAGGY